MGGKQKQAQRTKNNARPSSSGRSAELLRNSSTFVGFTNIKDGSSTALPGFSLSPPDDSDSSGNPEFKLVIKKMYKKDSTTKLKALQEFADLCKRSDINDVKGSLPQWPHIYNLLAMDADHRVREASHQAQRQLAISAKKSLAPFLKLIAGPWFTGQYDTYPPAASAARLAFQDAFPPSKIVEAIAFCQEDILNYIYDNLINQSATSLSNPKNSSVEEMEAKYIRILISSLQGYAFYLQQIPVSSLKNSKETNNKLISSAKFWKYASNESPLVRSAWFSALIALCHKTPFLLEDKGSRVANAIFGNLDESDPSTLPVVWEAALHALVALKDCWCHVDPHKIVFPKLWRILREGGQGNATTIFPNLLPFLSKIPSELLSDRESFYKKFFDNMREGFRQTSVQFSQSESNAVSVTFVECLKYTIMTHQEDPVFCKILLINQVFPVLQTSLTDKKWKLFIRPLYSEISSLINLWHRNSLECECYVELIRVFWEQLKNLMCEQIHETDSFPLISKNQLEFILHLKYPNRMQKKENMKVMFVEPEESPIATNSENVEINLDANLQSEDGMEHLLQLVLLMCDEYCEEATRNHSPIVVEALCNLILKYDSRGLVSHIASSICKGTEDFFSEEKILEWLQDPSMPTSKIAKVLFLILVQMDIEEKDKVLNLLFELNNNLVLQYCIIDAVTSHYKDDSIKTWLKSSRLSKSIVDIVKEISTNSLSMNVTNNANTFQITWDLLKCCFSKTLDGDFPVSIKTLVSILRILSDALSPRVSPHVTHADPNSSARFVGELTCALFKGDASSSVPLVSILLGNEGGAVNSRPAGSVLCDLALSMFGTCCAGQHHASVLHSSTLSMLSLAWQALVSSMAQALEIMVTVEPFLDIAKRFACATWMSISPLTGSASVEVAAMKAVTFMQASLVPCPISNNQMKDNILSSLCEVFFTYVTNSSNDVWGCWDNETIASMSLAAEVVRNSLCLRREVCICEGDPEKFLLSVSISLFRVIVLSKLWIHSGHEEEEAVGLKAENEAKVSLVDKDLDERVVNAVEEKETIKKSEKKEINGSYSKFLLRFTGYIVEALETYTLCKLFLLHYKNDLLSIKINSRFKLLRTSLKSVIGTMDDCGIEHIKRETISKLDENNGLGLWTLKFLYSEILCEKEMSKIFVQLRSSLSLKPDFHVQLIQIFSPFLGKEMLEGLASDSANHFFSLCNGSVTNAELEMVWPHGSLSTIVCALQNMDEEREAKSQINSQLEHSVTVALESVFSKRKSGNCTIFSRDLSNWNFEDTSAAIETVDFLEACVRKWRRIFSPQHWDSLLCSVVRWVQSIASNAVKHSLVNESNSVWWHNVVRASLCTSVFRLLSTIIECIEGSVPKDEGEKDVDCKNVSAGLPMNLISEWRDIYGTEIYHPIIRIFSLMIESETDRSSVWGRIQILLIEDIIGPIRVIPAGVVLNCPFPCLTNYKGIAKASYLVNKLGNVLRSPVPPLQTAAYLLILKLIPNLLEEDVKILSGEGSDYEKIYEKLSCYQLKDHLNEVQSVVDTMLMDFRIGDSCTVQPFTDTYTYTLAYFLYWKIILEMCRISESELRCHYAQWLRDSGHLNSLLQNLFRLLPDHLLQDCNFKLNVPSSRKVSSLFESKVSAQSYYGSVSTESLERLVCWVWGDAFRYLPALVRHWWNDLESRSSALVERLTAIYLSPLLCAEEMRAVQAEEKTFSNMLIRVHHTAREVVAVYTVDDAETELLIQLPTNHPLGLVKVEGGKNLFGTNQRYNWMRQITIFLNYQNGSIWDGLALWKKNLDKRFEGVEECYICYSILHNSNYQIPKLSCQTCKKKFHSQCLYKWFSTSNNSTCPICRNLWKY